jgi:NEDD8-activating enzyme E1 regulatory subunit
LPYSLIIIASPDVHPALRLKITEHASRSFTPLFYVHSVGFFAHFSMHLPPVFPIADTHPDPSSTSDLRLLKPWPALTEYALSKTKDLDALNDHEHGHIPYLLLLLHYLEEWKNTHNGKAPATYKEKTSFKELIEAGMRRQNPEGGEENFEQALGAVLKNMNEPVPNSAVLEVFKESEKQPEKSAKFWTIAKAIKLFYEKWGVLPVPGTVPDMKAQSTDYISLQNVYKDKAREDVKEVYATARSLDSSIDEREVEAFCKNAAHVKLIRGRPFNTARGDGIDWGGRAKSLASSVTDKSSLVDLYIAFLAYDEFHSLHSQAPGTFKFDDDKQELKGKGFIILRDLFKQAGLGPPEEEDRVEAENRVGDYCLEL